jgi:hypothetical protein
MSTCIPPKPAPAPITNRDVLFSCLAGVIRYHDEGHPFYSVSRGSKDWKTQGECFRYAVRRGYAEFIHDTPCGAFSTTSTVVRIKITDKGRRWVREQIAADAAGEGGAR